MIQNVVIFEIICFSKLNFSFAFEKEGKDMQVSESQLILKLRKWKHFCIILDLFSL